MSGPYARRAARALARRRARSAPARAASGSTRRSTPSACRSRRGRPADHPLRRGRPARQLAVLDHARGRPRALRARRRSLARPVAARDGLLVGAARVAEPPLGERRRSLAPVLALVLPAVPGRLPDPARRHARALPPRDQPLAPSLVRVDADETTYGLHIILRFELEQDPVRRPLDRRPPRRVEHKHGGARRRPPAERPARRSRTSTGRAACSATSRPTSSGTSSRCRSGNASSPTCPTRTTGSSPGSFEEIHEWLRERLYRHGRKFTPRRSRASPAGRSTRSRTCATSRTRTRRSRRRSWPPRRTASRHAPAPSRPRPRGPAVAQP